jgi:hypothetical protein
MNISHLIGKTLVVVKKEGTDRITFLTTEGEVYALYHSQDCCENVDIEDICGDLQDLVGTPILKAEEVTNSEKHPEDSPRGKEEYGYESFTWTFYHISTAKGTVTIRWFGQSNGYYSESVDFELLAK